MFDWVNGLWKWVTTVFKAAKDYLLDLPLKILDSLLSAIAGLFEAIPVPSFIDGQTLGDSFSGLPDSVLFFVAQSGLDEGLAILSAAFLFRMARKFITLFQW